MNKRALALVFFLAFGSFLASETNAPQQTTAAAAYQLMIEVPPPS